jgi:hypothetical protein
MAESTEARIQRWRDRIEECRREGESLNPKARKSLQIVIGSYERLIAMAERSELDKEDV